MALPLTGVVDLETSTPFLEKNLWVRIIIVITCALSMLGSLLIILSYLCCKDLRSRGRQVLINISIMDFGVAASNLFGAAVYFDRFYHLQSCSNCTTITSTIFSPSDCTQKGTNSSPVTVMCPDSIPIQYLCFSQAALSLCFTYGSILWTNALCFYLYFRIVHGDGQKIALCSLYVSYVFCYGMPLLITVWLGLTGRLGYSPYESSGWCSIVLMHPVTMQRDIYASVFGYNLWIVLTFFFVPILSCAVHINVKNKVKNTAVYRRSDKFMLALLSVDYKFIFIPLAFIFLRLWSFVGDVLHLYIGKTTLNEGFSFTLIVLGGIGDSGQGITNSILFLFLTKKVKDSVKGFCCNFIFSNGKALNIQKYGKLDNEGNDSSGEDKSFLDNTSVETVSPHQYTYQSFEDSTPTPNAHVQ